MKSIFGQLAIFAMMAIGVLFYSVISVVGITKK
jgi:hypothetical protein